VASHAAIEFFIEDLCRRGVHISLWKYSRGGGMSPLLESVCESYVGACVAELPRRADQFEFFSGDDLVSHGVRWMVKRIDSNNGVRKSNLLSLLLPLGFEEGDCDPLWFGAMDSLGSARGDVAHGRPASGHSRAPISIAVTGPANQ
jgi:hypothetical protein